jgi:hypothetical protein
MQLNAEISTWDVYSSEIQPYPTEPNTIRVGTSVARDRTYARLQLSGKQYELKCILEQRYM